MKVHTQDIKFITVTFFSVLVYMLCTSQAFALGCTSQFSSTALSAGNSGLITAIMANITALLEGTSERLYKHIIGDPSLGTPTNTYFRDILNASILLVIVFYGVMITFDLANLRPGEVLSRMFKIGLVIWIASPNGGWEFFNKIFAKFFYSTMLELIAIFLKGAAGMLPGANGGANLSQAEQLAAPLGILGYPISLIFSYKFMMTILGLMFTSTYGFILSLGLIWAGFSLLLAITQAMFVYVKCIVGMWFLFALAPIFFIFLLFQRTSKLFEGWLNLVINFALQPVLLFAFLSFFIVMITTSLTNIFRVDWCWKLALGWFAGIVPIPFMLPRASRIGNTQVLNDGWVDWSSVGLSGDPSIQFPIESIDLLFFLMSSYMMVQYGKFVPQLTQQLSQGGLTVGASMDDMRNFFQTRGWTPEQIGAQGLSFLGKKLS